MIIVNTKNKILQFLDYKGISKSTFYATTKIKRGFLDTDKLKSAVSDLFLARIIEKFPELNLYWLISGQGEMLEQPCSKKLEKIQEENTSPLLGIPLIKNLRISDWDKPETKKKLQAKQQYVVPEFKKVKADFILKVKGTGMYPKYNNEDSLACKIIPLDSYIEWNRVYLIETSQGVMAKRIQQSTNKNNVLCASDNVNYATFELSKNKIKSLAIVLGVIQIE